MQNENSWLRRAPNNPWVILTHGENKTRNALLEHRQYINERGEDHPFVLGWKWGEKSPVAVKSSSTEADNV